MRPSTRAGSCFLLAAFLALSAAEGPGRGVNAGEPGKPSLLETALSGPMKDVQEIIFCTRLPYDDPHWYANIAYFCDDERQKAYPGNGRPDVSALLKLNVRSGEVTTVLDAAGGSIRDPQVHYDGERIIFSYRKAGCEHYNLYEIRADGSDLRQITSGDFDDYEPVYLPDGDIVFVSTRCNRWVNCWMTQVGILYRSRGDGSDIHPISGNTEHENTPWVLPDGRILYMRWEYVDRSQVEFHHLWAMNPDGTGTTVFYGNLHPGILMIDAKPIPGTRNIIASFSPGHGVNEHAGIATILSPDAGPDDLSSARRIHGGRLIRDPFALCENCFIAARDREIVLMDAEGREQVIHVHKGPGGVHEPRPVVRRERERIFPSRPGRPEPKGIITLANVYEGRNLSGVREGDVKKLLVLESLSKPVNFSGGPDLVSWLGTFTLERVLGTVPVEDDGSACFEVPANRQVFFVALDEKDLSVKRMQSFASVVPGERLSCAGCHEQRTRAPARAARATGAAAALQALRRPPSRIEPFQGLPDVLDFHRDVQPILDKHCVKCHGYEKREGRVTLAGDLGPNWSHAYYSLLAHRQVADGRNGLGNQPPRTIGSSASPLLEKLGGSHHDVKASSQEWRTLWLWIESGAPYAGTYAALRNAAGQARATAATTRALQGCFEVFGRRCRSCHDRGSPAAIPFNYEKRLQDRGRVGRPTGAYERIIFENDPIARFSTEVLLNFSRPHLSPILLGPLAREAGGYGSCGDVFKDRNDPDCARLLAAIEAGKALIDAEPRFSTPGFKPNRQYVREMKKYGILPAMLDLEKDALDIFRTDQEYWRSLWTQGPRESAY